MGVLVEGSRPERRARARAEARDAARDRRAEQAWLEVPDSTPRARPAPGRRLHGRCRHDQDRRVAVARAGLVPVGDGPVYSRVLNGSEEELVEAGLMVEGETGR